MTRRDYELIAEAIADAEPGDCEPDDDPARWDAYGAARLDIALAIADGIEHGLHEEWFDRERFLEACRVVGRG